MAAPGTTSLTGATKDDTLIGGPGNDTLTGSSGNDTYVFDADDPLGSDTLSDSSGIETLDFSATTGQAIALNLGLTTVQTVNPNLSLRLTSASAFENVLGGAAE